MTAAKLVAAGTAVESRTHARQDRGVSPHRRDLPSRPRPLRFAVSTSLVALAALGGGCKQTVLTNSGPTQPPPSTESTEPPPEVTPTNPGPQEPPEVAPDTKPSDTTINTAPVPAPGSRTGS